MVGDQESGISGNVPSAPHTPHARPGGRTAAVTARIFGATTMLLVEGGYAAVTFQSVANRAGVARATLYRRWPNPAALLVDAVRAAAAARVDIPDSGTLRGDLRAVLRDVGAFIDSPIGRAGLIGGLTAAPFEQRGAQSWPVRWDRFRILFDRAIDRGELPSDADAPAIFAAMAGAIYFRAIVMNEAVDPAWVDRVVATL